MKDNNKKETKLTLSQFHNYVNEQARQQRSPSSLRERTRPRNDATNDSRSNAKPRSNGGSRLSDKLKERRDTYSETAQGSKRVRRKAKEVNTAARVTGSKPLSKDVDLHSQEMFPFLPSTETSTETTSNTNIGCWANGITTIINAVSLPDPAIERAKQMCIDLEARRQDNAFTNDHYDHYDNYDREYDDYQEGSSDLGDTYTVTHVSERQDGYSSDDETWDDVL